MAQLTLAVIVAFEIVSKDTGEVEKTTIVAVQLMIDDVITQLLLYLVSNPLSLKNF